MATFKIITEENFSDEDEEIKFYAVDEDGDRLFAATAELSRHKNIRTRNWYPWNISYCSGGDQTYEGQLPRIAAINAAMEKMKTLTN